MVSLIFADTFNEHALILLLVYLTIALGVSFLCSVAEAVLLSVTEPYVVSIRGKHPQASGMLAKFREAPDRPLTAILTLNTVAHTVGAAGVGHEAAVLLGESWLGVASGIMTILILVLSEIIPKTLGATRWRTLAPLTARCVTWLTLALTPIVSVMVRITQRLGHRSTGDLSIDEIRALLSIASRSRDLDASEASILNNLFQLREKLVRKIMTPRGQVIQVPAAMTVGEFRQTFGDCIYSRIPLFGPSSKDDISGFVLRVEVHSSAHDGMALEEIMRPISCVPDHFNIASLYAQFLKERSHIALVVNEFGDYEGIVTLEDVLEAVLGIEITDEADHKAEILAAVAAKKIKNQRK